MVSVLERRWRRLLGVLTTTLCVVVALGVSLARAETITVHVDQAQIIKLPQGVATVIVDNPLIVFPTLQSNNSMLLLTGRSYGATNLIVLDRAGKVVLKDTVRVIGVTGDNLITVYKGPDRETYSCNPKCEPRITLGDAPPFFNATLAQTGTRNSQAQANAGH
jgi:Pilus formation protein N terminal region